MPITARKGRPSQPGKRKDTMGEKKYQSLGMEYKLKGVPAMDKDKLLDKKKICIKEMPITARKGRPSQPGKRKGASFEEAPAFLPECEKPI